MKAERRHELQTNSLALWMRWRLPQLWEQHGTKILLALIAVALLVILGRHFLTAPGRALARAQQSLSQADMDVRNISMAQVDQDPQIISLVRSGEIPRRAKDAMDDSNKPYIQAMANDILGDYYWELARRRIDSSGTTRPVRTAAISEDMLKRAAEYYQKALDAKSEQTDLVARAHIGLAVIAETRAYQSSLDASFQFAEKLQGATTQPAPIDWSKNPQWDVARQQYEAVAKDSSMPKIMQVFAQQQLERLAHIQQNPVLATPPSANVATETVTPAQPLGPTTQPAVPTSQPAAAPSARPTTAPAK